MHFPILALDRRVKGQVRVHGEVVLSFLALRFLHTLDFFRRLSTRLMSHPPKETITDSCSCRVKHDEAESTQYMQRKVTSSVVFFLSWMGLISHQLFRLKNTHEQLVMVSLIFMRPLYSAGWRAIFSWEEAPRYRRCTAMSPEQTCGRPHPRFLKKTANSQRRIYFGEVVERSTC